MDMKSVEELLRFAISKEHAAEQFYLQLAAAVTDPATQAVYQSIAKQERRHAEALYLEMMKAGYTVRQEEMTPETADVTASGRLELSDDARNMGYIDALQLAIQKERAAFQLYAQLIGMAANLELRGMLLELAEEEMRHVLQFEREYETVTHHHKD